MKKILIPYDFSDHAQSILNYGLGLAKEISADVVLLNVISYPIITPESGLPAFSYEDVMKDDLKELQKVAAKIKTSEPSINNVACVSEMGDITEAIVEYCKNNPIEFVVMGIYQHGNKFMKVLMGSNAVETSHKIKCTVIIIPPQTIYKKPATIAFASDHHDAGTHDPSLQKAKTVSDLLHAELQILHVVPENHHFAPSEVVLDNYFESKSEKTPHKLFIITEKKVSEGLLGMLENKLIDMILLEPKEHGIFYNLFHESVSKEVAFASPVPVVLIHS